MIAPYIVPDNAPSPFTAPNGMSVYHWDESEIALAQDKYDELTTQPQQLENGEQRPLTREEILFFKWLGKVILIVLARAIGIPL